MRENRTYGSVRGGQSNLIPSTRLTAFQAEGGGITLAVHSEHILHYANWICKGASAT